MTTWSDYYAQVSLLFLGVFYEKKICSFSNCCSIVKPYWLCTSRDNCFEGAPLFRPHLYSAHHDAAYMVRQHRKRLQEPPAMQIYPAMQLGGSPPQLFDQARDGVADVIWTIPGYTAGRFPKMEVFELPFMMTNAEATSRAAWDSYEKFAKDE